MDQAGELDHLAGSTCSSIEEQVGLHQASQPGLRGSPPGGEGEKHPAAAAGDYAGLAGAPDAPTADARLNRWTNLQTALIAAAVAVACDLAAARYVAAEVGYPMLVKAVGGGGGRGMKLVRSAEELPGTLDTAVSDSGQGVLLVTTHAEILDTTTTRYAIVSCMESAGSRRPASTRGPVRDAERDQRIIRAALELLGEDGFEALTMERTAARAGVAKATVYRRWAAKTDLAVDALRTLDDGPVPIPPGTGPTLRAELLGVLAAATGCSDTQRHAVSVALAEGARRHPVLAEAFQRQVVDMYLTTLRDIVVRAASRGEISTAQRDRVLDDDALEITTGPALALYRFLADGRTPDPRFVEKIVDRVMLPLMTRSF